MEIDVRRFREEDLPAVHRLILRALREVNARDYPPARIEEMAAGLGPDTLRERARQGHSYVACLGGRPVGCGTVASYWGSVRESILLTVFVSPEAQGRGVGRAIVRALEGDGYFLRAQRVEVPASLTAWPFYQKMGYRFKGGAMQVDEGGCVRMEKFPPQGRGERG